MQFKVNISVSKKVPLIIKRTTILLLLTYSLLVSKELRFVIKLLPLLQVLQIVLADDLMMSYFASNIHIGFQPFLL